MGAFDKLARIAEQRKKHREHEAVLDLAAQLLRLRADFKGRLRVRPSGQTLVEARLKAGEPAIRPGELWVDPKEPVEYGRRVADVFAKFGLLPDNGFDLPRQLEEFERGAAGTAESPDVPGTEASTDVHRLLFLQVLKPYYETCGEMHRSHFNETEWVQPRCWVCGGPPHLSVVRGEEGRRYLYCNVCDTEWRFIGLVCPFCGNEDQGSLSGLVTDGSNRYTVDLCHACRHYIKVIDARTDGEMFPELEDIMSYHLDIAARNEGFE